jgi:pimeloyl-ACP methyl ester carboxylesterase
VVLEGAGHMVHYDAPEAFCGAVQRFIGAGST